MSEDIYVEIGESFASEHGTSLGQMFGKPCMKTGKKAFSAFFKGEMVFKVGHPEIAGLKIKYPGSVNWDPSGKGRAMKDWLQVPEEYSDAWSSLAQQAMENVEERG